MTGVTKLQALTAKAPKQREVSASMRLASFAAASRTGASSRTASRFDKEATKARSQRAAPQLGIHIGSSAQRNPARTKRTAQDLQLLSRYTSAGCPPEAQSKCQNNTLPDSLDAAMRYLKQRGW